ncbi:MAG: 3-methyl-2-oxobutanoate hydroxymethyltransferase [Spirochaetes bacterium GWD1_27_9]|nr:MAG: 3-methyl-2-oxobutanoate hydroxymethyltransferase [Spirochaetes bacterium GWB1_27_13]OHD24570.1 MAG: 3-methyl-2-oxobutanoate hydroxymethyltransferase [Spirochaetes bacterium GWC1_27_15]OHD40538.1 MAG: 3-methyl-2-oxobutanoate hydroxymethyltransferase [Spirochaetes bacterium GWD1_27_9]
MKNSINLFYDKKGKEPISMLTCYDYSTAKFLDESEVDAILVGDSLGMVFQGNNDTIPVTVDEMIYHTKAVRKGCPNKFLVIDMPFLSYHITKEDAIRNSGRVIKETGANAVKVEGGAEIIDKIRGLLDAKIPVLGHLGLTPQSVNVFGGFKIQGKSFENAKKIIEDALLLEKEGVFAIVLEGIPEKLAKFITEKLKIATIGIGAGRYTDGQILVINDIFGMYKDMMPKFVKKFGNVGEEMQRSIGGYVTEVKGKQFPEEKHTFAIEDDIIEKLKKEF